MNVTAILQAHGFVPSVPSPRKEVGTPQTLVASRVPTVPTVSIEKGRPATKTAKAVPADSGETRTALLVLADRLVVNRAHVHRLDDAEVAMLMAMGEGGMRAFLLAAEDAATRQAGKVPQSDTAAICCARCGPVFVHPVVAAVLPVVDGWPRAIGCPWCVIRRARGYVPRPQT